MPRPSMIGTRKRAPPIGGAGQPIAHTTLMLVYFLYGLVSKSYLALLTLYLFNAILYEDIKMCFKLKILYSILY